MNKLLHSISYCLLLGCIAMASREAFIQWDKANAMEANVEAYRAYHEGYVRTLGRVVNNAYVCRSK